MTEILSTIPSRQVVVLDANALMMPFQFGINIDLELGRLVPGCEIVVPSSVIAELRAVLEKTNDPTARGALSLAPKYRIFKTGGAGSKTGVSGDEAILGVARGLKAVIVTNDRELRARAQAAGLKVIGLRGKNHLEFL
jgi:rRNA-processing protein FCF1